ncbi:MAG: 23S rRNA (guanosine(2251)-2'-O)-methyltransferase RlmB [Flavobacteriales bacterium]
MNKDLPSKGQRPRFHSTEKRKTYSNLLIGMRPLMEAIQAGKEIDKIFMQKGLKGELFQQVRELANQNQIPIQMVPIEKLNGITKANHQGVLAFVSPIAFGNLSNIIADVFESGETAKLIMLDGVTDVRNFGAICRSAECQGFHAVIIPEKGSAQINEDAVKTSAGALFNIPVCRVGSLLKTVKDLQMSGIRVTACTEKTNDLIDSLDFDGPHCIVMGNEETGISDEIIRIADQLGKIYMTGKTSSLNVGVAAGIIMYELNRQRNLHSTI